MATLAGAAPLALVIHDAGVGHGRRRDLNRLTSAPRIFTVIPIALVLATIGGYSASWANGAGATSTIAVDGTGQLFLPPLLMIVVVQLRLGHGAADLAAAGIDSGRSGPRSRARSESSSSISSK